MESMARWLVALVVAVSGCGFSLSGPDPDRPHDRLPECSTSKAAVAVDGVMAGILGVTTLLVVSEEPGVALLPLAIGALYVASAISGNRSVDRCREAMNEFAARYSDGRHIVAGHPDDDVSPPRRPMLRPPGTPGPVAPAPPLPGAVAPTSPSPTHGAAPPAPPAPSTAVPPAPSSAPPPGATAKRPPARVDDDWSEFWQEVP
jgi:hypothetical protein